MSCKLCGANNTSSFGMQTQHIYCHVCGGHEYEGQLIDKKAWEAWINGETKRPKRKASLKPVQ
ncbi:hypothetical protein B0E42_13100 [Pseudomonas sp. A25(2017)]|nr:hypothetical protein B0E42_13100 [Pseudomonas sp. A25(2017)]